MFTTANVAISQLGIGYWQHFHIGNISKKPCISNEDFGRIKAFSKWEESHLLAEKVGKMPYEVLEKEMEKLDETQKNAGVMFVRFLVSQQPHTPPSGRAGRRSKPRSPRKRKIPLFGALKDKIKFIAPDFDEPLEDFAEYM